MIISSVLVPTWYSADSDFAIDIVNLEAVPLTFRFRYTLSPETAPRGVDMTASLNAKVRLKHRLMSTPGWTRSGKLYRTDIDVILEPEVAHHEGLYVLDNVPSLGSSDNVSDRVTLRGFWELTLPMVPSRSGRQVVQLDHPARVLITVSHHAAGSADASSPVMLPLASGRAEHLIPPERPLPVGQTAGTGVGVRVKRASPKRKRAAKRATFRRGLAKGRKR